MSVIQLDHLRKVFPAQRHRAELVAVDNISFSVDEGERLAYIGPNGAGKSTSIKMLTGILYPTSGNATVLDIVPWTHRKELAHHIGTLFGQRSQLWFQLTPRQSFSLLARIYGLSREAERKRLQDLGEMLEANDLFDQPVRGLSLGQRMRCELVASLLHSPRILFLDEPTIGLDLIAKARFRDLILRINEEDKTTIFLTSHDVSDIEQVARRVIVINHGRVIYDDKVSKLRRSLLASKEIKVLFAETQDSVDIPGAKVTKLTGAGATIEVDTDKHAIREVLDALLDRYPVIDISVSDPPLEDVIAQIYSQPA